MWASAASAGGRGRGALCSHSCCQRTSGTRSWCSARQTSARDRAGQHVSLLFTPCAIRMSYWQEGASMRQGAGGALTNTTQCARLCNQPSHTPVQPPATASVCGLSRRVPSNAGRRQPRKRRPRAWYVRSKPLQGLHQVSEASSTMSRGACCAIAKSNCSSLVRTCTSPGRHCRSRAARRSRLRPGPMPRFVWSGCAPTGHATLLHFWTTSLHANAMLRCIKQS